VLDPLEGKAQAALDILKQKHDGQVDVPPDQVFMQFEDWQKVYQLADVVLITTPPGPRPFLFEQAIKAGKHVFMEKPVAVDVVGVRRVLAAAEEAKKKNLNVCVGFQCRYAPSYIDASIASIRARSATSCMAVCIGMAPRAPDSRVSPVRARCITRSGIGISSPG
jgi:predicted dehydrogenase